MSSFKRISEDLDDLDVDTDKQQIHEEDVVFLRDKDTVMIRGIKYRKADFSTQDRITHYLIDQRNLSKVHLHSKGWFVQCAKHVCHINCVDSGGLKCDGNCDLGVH